MWWIQEIIKQRKTLWRLLSSSARNGIRFRTFPSIFSDDQGTVRRYPVSDWAITWLLAKVNRARETISVKATFCYRAYVWGGCPWITCKDLGRYPAESIKWCHNRLAWCPKRIRITHDVHVESLFLFSMSSVNTHHASRITRMWSRGFMCIRVDYYVVALE